MLFEDACKYLARQRDGPSAALKKLLERLKDEQRRLGDDLRRKMEAAGKVAFGAELSESEKADESACQVSEASLVAAQASAAREVLDSAEAIGKLAGRAAELKALLTSG